MNAVMFSELLTDISDAYIVSAADPHCKTVRRNGHSADDAFSVSPDSLTGGKNTARNVPDSPPRWFTAATLAACMLFVFGVGAFLIHGNRDELTTQSSQTDSLQDMTLSAVTETTADTGGTDITTTQTEPAPSHDTEPAAADGTEDTVDGTALTENGEMDAVTAQTTTGTVPQTNADGERRTDFRGKFGHRASGFSFYQGEEPDYGKLEIAVYLEDQWGTYGCQIGWFSAESGAHANCYTLDTSEVDPDTPGTYYVYVDTVEGAEDDFENYEENPQIGLTRGPIHVTMVKSRTAFMTTVLEKHTELFFGSSDRTAQEFSIPDNRSVQFFRLNNLWEDNDSAVYTFSDPSVAEITGKNMDVYGCTQVLQIRGLKAGETTLTATAADGRTASCLFRVIPAEEYYIEPEPITTEAIW